MTTKYIPLNSILNEIQNSMYKINKNSSKGVMIKNIDLTLHCLIGMEDDTNDIMVHLVDFNQATNKDFKEASLSQMKFTLFDILMEKKDRKEKIPTDTPQNINNTKEKEVYDKNLNSNKNNKSTIIKYSNFPIDFNVKKKYKTII